MLEVLIVVLLVCILLLVGYLLVRKQKIDLPEPDTQGLVMLQSQMSELTRAMDAKLGEGTQRMFD